MGMDTDGRIVDRDLEMILDEVAGDDDDDDDDADLAPVNDPAACRESALAAFRRDVRPRRCRVDGGTDGDGGSTPGPMSLPIVSKGWPDCHRSTVSPVQRRRRVWPPTRITLSSGRAPARPSWSRFARRHRRTER